MRNEQTNELYTTLVVKNENKKKYKKRGGGWASWLNESQPLCLAPKRWAAWWYGSLAWMSSFFSLYHSFPTINCSCVIGTPNSRTVFLYLPPWCFDLVLNTPLEATCHCFKSLYLGRKKPEIVHVFIPLLTQHCINWFHCVPHPDWRSRGCVKQVQAHLSTKAFHHRHVLKVWTDAEKNVVEKKKNYAHRSKQDKK